MKKILLLLIPIFLFADSKEELIKCYNKGLGDNQCGKELAYIYKQNAEYDAAEIFLDLMIKGDTDATRELGLLYIYGKEIPRDCKKGVSILLNSITKEDRKTAVSFLDISNLFKDGICLEKDEVKAKKYYDIYMNLMKEKLKAKP